MLNSGQIALTLIVLVVICWMINEFYVTKHMYTKSEQVSKEAKRSNNWLLFATIWSFISLFGTMYINTNLSTIGFYPNFLLSYAGSAIAFLGIVMRRVAINTLSQHFDSLIQVKENQQLIQHGLYKYLRHPSYTGTIITFFGFGLASMNVFNLILLPLLFILVYHYRTNLEEEVLEKGFGEEYHAYKERTWRLFPSFKNKKKKVTA